MARSGPFLVRMKVKVKSFSRSWLFVTLWTVCSPPFCFLYGIFQAGILEWVAISFSRGSSRPRNQTGVSCIAGGFFTNWAIREALIIAASKKSTNNKCWRGCGEKGTLLCCWWEWKLVQPLWRTVWHLLKKLELELPYNPAILLLGIHTEETRIERDTCIPMFIAALFTIARTWKQPRYSLTRWIDKEVVIHIYNEILLSHKKQQIWVSSSEVDESRACYTEWSKSERENQISFINIYICNLEKGYWEAICRAIP